jgi:hypothetical protein
MKSHEKNLFQNGKTAVTAMFAFALMVLILGDVCLPSKSLAASGNVADFNVLVGKWVRPDGGYIIQVREINADGTVGAGYFNPREIHVAEAKVSVQKGLLKLHMRLEGKGYPGSTYDLYYYAERDALAGFYYQATIDQTFQVVFVRQKGRK